MATSSFQGGSHPLQGQKLGKTARAKDPNLSGPAGSAPQPTPAPLTTDNNRITFRVPAEATKLNLGQGDAKETATRNKRIGVGTENGIVGQTDNHIHFHVFGTPNPLEKTLVRLGTPPTSVPPNGYAAGASTGIGCMFPEAYSVWNGYSMITQGAAYQEAQQNHLISSATGEVRVVGKTLISLASAGDVVIGADPSVTPTTLIQNQGSPDAPGAYGEPDKYFRIQKIASIVTDSVHLVEAAVGLVRSIGYGIVTVPINGVTGWGMDGPGWLKNFIFTSAELAFGLAGVLDEAIAPTSPSGNVGMYAEKTVSVGAAESVSINAGALASIVAGFTASLTAPLVSLNGLFSATVSGIEATVGALKTATLQGTFGGAIVRSPAPVQVYSSLDTVTVTGMRDVQLNSVLGSAYVHGLRGAYVGGGEADGWGMLASPIKLEIGQMAMPGIFSNPGFMPFLGITITESMLNAQHTDSIVRLSPSGVNIITPETVSTVAPIISAEAEDEFNVDAPLVTIAGGKVMLG